MLEKICLSASETATLFLGGGGGDWGSKRMQIHKLIHILEYAIAAEETGSDLSYREVTQ